MTRAGVCAILLVLLGGWGVFTARPLWTTSRPWTQRHWLLLAAEVALISGSWLSAAALSIGRFSPWMVLPVGVSYALMIPLPCYFELVNRIGWIHALRNALFAIIAAACLAVTGGFIPLSTLGLS